MKSTIRLTDDTVGVIETTGIDDLVALHDKYVVVELHDENGLPVQVAGIMAEIIE